jgi:hypothetical protein
MEHWRDWGTANCQMANGKWQFLFVFQMRIGKWQILSPETADPVPVPDSTFGEP